jgi:hypothetical protein
MATRKKKARPFWERGYDTHGYWQDKKKIGWVALEGKGQGGLYRWQAGSRVGEARTLVEAKRAVEETVLSHATQLSLSGEPDGD